MLSSPYGPGQLATIADASDHLVEAFLTLRSLSGVKFGCCETAGRNSLAYRRSVGCVEGRLWAAARSCISRSIDSN